MRSGASTSIAHPATSVDVMGESTTVGLFEAKLRIRVFNKATLRADAISVRHSAHTIQGIVVRSHRLAGGMHL